MKTLKSAEHGRIFPQLRGAALMSAFYMNELLLKLTHREEAHECLFDAYEQAVAMLADADIPEKANDVRGIATVLRRFEISLLQEIGYALNLLEEADSREPLQPNQRYYYIFEHGPIGEHRWQHWQDSQSRSQPPLYLPGQRDGLQLHGKTLLDMAVGDFTDPVTQNQAKQLMRRAINHVLGDKTLHTRQLIRDLQSS